MNILLRSVTIVDAGNKALHQKKRDIYIKNGILEKIAEKIEVPSGTKTISIPNLHVSNGWFDSSVSFGEPGFEERETIKNGLATAAKSGFTDIVLNPTSHPLPDSSSDISFLINRSQQKATNLYPMGCLSVRSEGNDLAELFDMKNAGAVGHYDFKRPIANSNLLKIALQYVQGFEGLVLSFPLDYKIAGKGMVNEGGTSTRLGLKGIPSLAEELQISRDLYILEYTGGKLHIPTISSANSVKLIAAAKKKGLDVSCSVAIHNLMFTDSELEEFDTHFKTMPPLRTKRDIKQLVKGVLDGTIDMVTSDHGPMDVEQKRVEFDNAAYGTTGLESAFGSLNQLLGTDDAVALLCKGRERFGLETPQLKVGEQACLTLFDPEPEYVFESDHIFSTSKNSMFLGRSLKGKVYGIINNNELIQ